MEKGDIYKNIYDDFCKWIKEREKDSFLFIDNDGSIIKEAWDDIVDKWKNELN